MNFHEEGGVGLATGPLLDTDYGVAESLEEFITGRGLIEVAAEIGTNLLLEADVKVSGQGRQRFEAGGSSLIGSRRLRGRDSRFARLFASRHVLTTAL